MLFGFLALGTVARGAAAEAPIDDFEDGDLIAFTGSAWVTIADDLLGGQTVLRLEPVKDGARGSRGALRLAGTIGDGAGAFAGAWTSVTEGGRAGDLSRFEGLRLSVRGPGEVLVGVRAGPLATSVNFMARVTAGPGWTEVTLPFTRLEPQAKGQESTSWDPRQARWLGVSSVPGASGPFAIEIDDLAWVGADGSATAPIPAEGEPPMARPLVPDDAGPLRALAWRELARDGEADGRPGLPDARALFVARDPARPLAWFRIDLQDAPPASWIGVNVALDLDGDPANGTAWWGKNTAFRFDRLVTAWVWRVGDRYEGSVGIASSADAAEMRFTNQAEVHLAVDRPEKRVYVGVPAGVLEPAGTRIVAAVGSPMSFADDLPDEGAATVPPGGDGGGRPSRQ
jgi:hypothetical protein